MGLTVLNVKKNVIVTMEPFVIILMDGANVFQVFKESRYDGCLFYFNFQNGAWKLHIISHVPNVSNMLTVLIANAFLY